VVSFGLIAIISPFIAWWFFSRNPGITLPWWLFLLACPGLLGAFWGMCKWYKLQKIDDKLKKRELESSEQNESSGDEIKADASVLGIILTSQQEQERTDEYKDIEERVFLRVASIIGETHMVTWKQSIGGIKYDIVAEGTKKGMRDYIFDVKYIPYCDAKKDLYNRLLDRVSVALQNAAFVYNDKKDKMPSKFIVVVTKANKYGDLKNWSDQYYRTKTGKGNHHVFQESEIETDPLSIPL